LLHRYRFHVAVQALLQGLESDREHVLALYGRLSTQRYFEIDDFRYIRDTLQAICQGLTDNLEDARRFDSPALANVPAGSPLYTLIVDREGIELRDLGGDQITGEWLGRLMARLDLVLVRIRRLHYKSLGGMLALQERLATDWVAPIHIGEELPRPADQPT
jgi:hypothetical protein